jgi:hypothetical protein
VAIRRGTYTTFNILLSTPEAVLEEYVEDTPKTEGRLDDIRDKLANCVMTTGHTVSDAHIPTTDGCLPDCLNDLRSTVSISGVSSNELPSEVVMIALLQIPKYVSRGTL